MRLHYSFTNYNHHVVVSTWTARSMGADLGGCFRMDHGTLWAKDRRAGLGMAGRMEYRRHMVSFQASAKNRNFTYRIGEYLGNLAWMPD